MSQQGSRRGSAIFEEEDNSPFPQTQISELIKSPNSPEANASAEAGSNSSVSGAGVDQREASGLIQSLSAQSDLRDSEDKSDEPDDQDLILFNSERDNYNAVNINHESRVVKILSSESPVEIQISEAGKSNEGMANSLKKYIVYTIKLIQSDGIKEEIQTRRRYSDFESLRDILNKIFPLIVIPPIPPKNYFALNVWNGLVGSNGAASPTGPPENLNTEGTLIAGGLNAYSYINSKHLNKGRLVEHRKRLLANFLNNCLRIRQIRNLGFFAKFLDPTANWSDEVSLILGQLPKLIYQLNPENGLKTEAIYKDLPLPVSQNALGLSFLKASKFAQKTSQMLGNATSDIVNAASASTTESTQSKESSPDSVVPTDQVMRPSDLDEINKKIMGNLLGLSNDYVELGVVLNLISLGVVESSKAKDVKDSDLEDTTKLDFIFDKIGMAFDRSYLTLNSLMSELETKFSEPLGEAVQYSSVLNSVKKFKEKKLKQQSLIEVELKDKRKDLSDKMRSELDATKRDQENTPTNKGERESWSKGGFMSKMSSLKKITDYVSTMIDQTPELTRKEKITQLQKRIVVLEKCQNIMMEDLAYITCELDRNQGIFKQKELITILLILRSYNQVFVSWARKNLEIWEEIREEIEKTEF